MPLYLFNSLIKIQKFETYLIIMLPIICLSYMYSMNINFNTHNYIPFNQLKYLYTMIEGKCCNHEFQKLFTEAQCFMKPVLDSAVLQFTNTAYVVQNDLF